MSEPGLLAGLDLGGTKLGVCLGRPDGVLLAADELPNDPDAAPGGLLDQALARLEALTREAGGERPAALGVAAPGPLDPRAGRLLEVPNMPRWQGLPLRDELVRRSGLPVAVRNDANASVLAEWRWGAARGADTAVFLTMSTGMGAGLIVCGRLVEGGDGLAGEVGHLRLSDQGPVGFGKAGSVEGWTSGPGLVAQARSQALLRRQRGEATALPTADEPCDAARVCRLAAEGDAAARATTDAVAARLGQLCALLTDLLNPDVIVVGTIASAWPELFLPGARAVLDAEALPVAAARVRLVPSGLEQRGHRAALAAGADLL